MKADRDALIAHTQALLRSDRVTEPTRRALMARMTPAEAMPRCLSDPQRMTLRAVAGRLVPLKGLGDLLALAERYEADLAQGPGDGWRYADLPEDSQVAARGLDALDAAAVSAFGGAFHALSAERQDELLAEIQAGHPRGTAWPFSPQRWFEEMLAAVARLAYSHPVVQVAIGYDGFADAHGMALRP
jgi:gluconate 2-dehydrogenase gamma chain